MYRTKLKSESGFSLVELMIAISILAVGLLATATMLTTGMSSNRSSYRQTVETSIANSVLDEILSMSTADALFDATSTNVVYDLDTGSAATTRTVESIAYSATYSITPNVPVLGSATVTVTVTGGGRTATLSTIKRAI